MSSISRSPKRRLRPSSPIQNQKRSLPKRTFLPQSLNLKIRYRTSLSERSVLRSHRILKITRNVDQHAALVRKTSSTHRRASLPRHSFDHGWDECHDRRSIPSSPLQRRQQVLDRWVSSCRRLTVGLFTSDEDTEETGIFPDYVDEASERLFARHESRWCRSEETPSLRSALPKDDFPLLQVDYKPFYHSIEENTISLSLLGRMKCERCSQSDSILCWTMSNVPQVGVEWMLSFHRIGLFIADLQSNHLRACLCYVQIALESSKSDRSEDSIERDEWATVGLFSSRVRWEIQLFCSAEAQIQAVGWLFCSATILSLSLEDDFHWRTTSADRRDSLRK